MEEVRRTFRFEVGDIVRMKGGHNLLAPTNKKYTENLTINYRFWDGVSDVYVVSVGEDDTELVAIGEGMELMEEIAEDEQQKVSKAIQQAADDLNISVEDMVRTREANREYARVMLGTLPDAEELSHYRNLRGEVFLEFLRKSEDMGYKTALDCAKYATWELYKQDIEFKNEAKDYEKDQEK